MTFKDVFYIIIYLLFVCVLVLAFVRARKESKANKEDADGGENE